MLYAIRRLDTRQLFAGFSYSPSNRKHTATWASATANPTTKPLIFDMVNMETLDEIREVCGLEAIFVPVSIGG